MKALSASSRVAVVAPASLPRDADRVAACAMLDRIGLHHELLGVDERHLSRTRDGDRLRAQRFTEAFTRTDIDVVMCLRGGYGSGRIIEHLDLDAITASPKILLGYSDITHLLFALRTFAGVQGFHGPVLTDLARNRSPEAVAACFEVLGGVRSGYALPIDAEYCVRHGEATGPLLGGNLAVLSAMAGTPELRIDDGAILFLEDINEFMYQMDRYLTQLRRCGVLERIGAILVGRSVIKDPDGASLGLRLPEMLREHLRDFVGPVVLDVPLGHTRDQITLPFGARATVQITERALSLEFEPPLPGPAPAAREFVARATSAALDRGEV